MSDDDEFRRVAEIERAANGKLSYLQMDAAFCAHNGGVRKRADWRHHYAWNSEPDIRLGPNCEISLLAQRPVTTNRWSGWRRARADLKS
jgi:hypothetical protein